MCCEGWQRDSGWVSELREAGLMGRRVAPSIASQASQAFSMGYLPHADVGRGPERRQRARARCCTLACTRPGRKRESPSDSPSRTPCPAGQSRRVSRQHNAKCRTAQNSTEQSSGPTVAHPASDGRSSCDPVTSAAASPARRLSAGPSARPLSLRSLPAAAATSL